jgi:hypothetical protein
MKKKADWEKVLETKKQAKFKQKLFDFWFVRILKTIQPVPERKKRHLNRWKRRPIYS